MTSAPEAFEGTSSLRTRGAVVLSPVMSALRQAKVVPGDVDDHADFFAAYTILHARMARSIQAAHEQHDRICKLRQEEGIRVETKHSPIEAVDSIQNVMYRLLELEEFYAKDLPRYFNVSGDRNKKEYVRKIKLRSGKLCVLTQKLKHNHWYLSNVEMATGDDHYILGFYVLNSKRGTVSAEFRGSLFSYVRIITEAIVTIVRWDQEAAQFVGDLSAEQSSSLQRDGESLRFTWPYGHHLESLMRMPRTAFPGEAHDCDFDVVFEEEDGFISIGDGKFLKDPIFPISIGFAANIYHAPARIAMPYRLGDSTVNISDDNVLPIELRIQGRVDFLTKQELQSALDQTKARRGSA